VTTSYQEQWQAYRVRRRNLVLLLLAQFIGIIPFLSFVAFIDRKLFSVTSLVMPAAFVWALWYLSTAFRLRSFPCPRCGKNFLDSIFNSYRNPRAYLFGRECFYCACESLQTSSAKGSHAREAVANSCEVVFSDRGRERKPSCRAGR